MKKKIRLVYASIIILLVIVVIATIFLVGKKKKPVAFQEVKVIENDEVKIEVVNISKMNEYLAVEYSVTAKKGSSYFDAYADTSEGTDYLLHDVIKINDQIAYDTMQMSDRISDTELKLIELIDLSEINLDGNANVEISVYKDAYMVDDYEYELEKENEVDYEIYYDYDVDEDDYEEDDETYVDDELDYEDSEFASSIEGEYVVGGDNGTLSTKTDDEDVPVESEKTNDTKDNSQDNNSKDSENELIGTLKMQLDTAKIEREVDSKDIQNEQVDISEDICIKSIQEIVTQTNEKIIIVNSEMNNISTTNESSKIPSKFSLNIQDDNNNTVDVAKCEIVNIVLDDGRDWKVSGEEEIEAGKALIKTVILLNDDLNKIKIQPVYQESTELSLDDWNNKEWHKVEDEKFEGTNDLGGKLNITKVEEKNGELLFHYNTSGCISESESMLIVKNADEDEYETCHIRRKNGNDKIAGYVVNNDVTNEVNELEFSIFEGFLFEKLGNGIDIQI